MEQKKTYTVKVALGCTMSDKAYENEEWFNSTILSNATEFDAEKLDNFVVERLQEICNILNTYIICNVM